MSNSREFDDSLGHAGADADILNAFKRRAHKQSNIGGTAAGTVYQDFRMENDFAQPEIGMPMKKQVQHLLLQMMCYLEQQCAFTLCIEW